MYVAQQAVDDIQSSCNNITALTEAIDVVSDKQEILNFTTKIQENINIIKNSLQQININLNENLDRINELETNMTDILAEFDDIDMEMD